MDLDKFIRIRERCSDCGYLVEMGDGQWYCDDCGLEIFDIKGDECSANQISSGLSD